MVRISTFLFVCLCLNGVLSAQPSADELFASSKWAEALEAYESSSEEPTAQRLYAMGVAAAHTGQLARAIAYLRRSQEGGPFLFYSAHTVVEGIKKTADSSYETQPLVLTLIQMIFWLPLLLWQIFTLVFLLFLAVFVRSFIRDQRWGLLGGVSICALLLSAVLLARFNVRVSSRCVVRQATTLRTGPGGGYVDRGRVPLLAEGSISREHTSQQDETYVLLKTSDQYGWVKKDALIIL